MFKKQVWVQKERRFSASDSKQALWHSTAPLSISMLRVLLSDEAP